MFLNPLVVLLLFYWADIHLLYLIFHNWMQCSFVEHRKYKIVYRRYASLFFMVGIDNEEVSVLLVFILLVYGKIKTLVFANIWNDYFLLIYAFIRCGVNYIFSDAWAKWLRNNRLFLPQVMPPNVALLIWHTAKVVTLHFPTRVLQLLPMVPYFLVCMWWKWHLSSSWDRFHRIEAIFGSRVVWSCVIRCGLTCQFFPLGFGGWLCL